MKKHRVSIETLYHYSCWKCSKWWSIGDHQGRITAAITCPHCGTQAEAQAAVGAGSVCTGGFLTDEEVADLLDLSPKNPNTELDELDQLFS